MGNVDILTIEETAALLRLHPRTVMGMARRGEIPGSKIGRQWRFHRMAIDSWLNVRLRMESAADAPAMSNPMPVSWVDLLGPVEAQGMEYRPRLEGPDPGSQALSVLARLLCRNGPAGDPEQLWQALLERERMQPTATGRQIAFPHPRRPVVGLSRTVLAALVLGEAIPFGAPDGAQIAVLVAFCAPDDTSHVRVLGGLARLFRSPERVTRMRSCCTREALANTLRELMQVEIQGEANF